MFPDPYRAPPTLTGNQSVLVFIWNSTAQSATLIREFHPGPMEWQFGVVAGGYEAHKHASPLHAARCEVHEHIDEIQAHG